MTTQVDLLDLVGQPMGRTDWHQITQPQVNLFADATRDYQWIHVDPQRAKAGPLGGTIAHGYHTLALAPLFLAETVSIEHLTAGLNYGLNSVRFPAPVPVGAHVRAQVTLVAARERSIGIEAIFAISVELDGSTRPACVAEVIVLYQ